MKRAVQRVVKDWYDLPDEMVRAQEEGVLVFFCGAGIAVPARLPDFAGLVRKLFRHFRRSDKGLAGRMRQNGCDMVLNELLCGDDAVTECELKETVSALLAVEPSIKEEHLATHKALLALSRYRDTRQLVTTNFDSLFALAAEKEGTGEALKSYTAPHLPVLKPGRWDGLVYLHGRLPQRDETGRDSEELIANLVISSADFGRAYISEGWAARLVSDLFAHYSVCLIGYSAGDAPVRYALDALAADRRGGLGDGRSIWAFCAYDGTDEDKKKQGDFWQQRGVDALLYDKKDRHSALHHIVREWGGMVQQGPQGKAAEVERVLRAHANGATPSDRERLRLRRALLDPSGMAAQRFLKVNPSPAIWLDALVESHLGSESMWAFGLGRDRGDEALNCSLLRRSSVHREIMAMSLCGDGQVFARSDAVLDAMTEWAVLNLNSPELLSWVCRCGGVLHPRFSLGIRDQLAAQAKGSGGGALPVGSGGCVAGMGMVSAPMLLMWEYARSGKMACSNNREKLSWNDFFAGCGHGADVQIRHVYRGLVEPRIKVLSFRQDQQGVISPTDQMKPCEIFSLEMVLNGGAPSNFQLGQNTGNGFLCRCYRESMAALKECWEIMQTLGLVSQYRDPSLWFLPRIDGVGKRMVQRDWVFLIERVRDDFLWLSDHDKEAALGLVEEWERLDWPLFYRLWLFAAAQGSVITDEMWLNRLEREPGKILWQPLCAREVRTLFKSRAPDLSTRQYERLKRIIENFAPEGVAPEDIENRRKGLLDTLEKARRRDLAEEDASFEVVSMVDPDAEIEDLPTDWTELALWRNGLLKGGMSEDQSKYEYERWRKFCRIKARLSLVTIVRWLRRGFFDAELLSTALHESRFARLNASTVGIAASGLSGLTRTQVASCIKDLALWVEQGELCADTSWSQERFIKLCDHIVDAAAKCADVVKAPKQRRVAPTQEMFSNALWHPAGRCAKAVVRLMQQDPDGCLWSWCKKALERILAGCEEAVFAARVAMCEMMPDLFYYDEVWTAKQCYSLLDWEHCEDAGVFWYAFLCRGGWYPDMVAALKDSLRETARHYDVLDDCTERYVYLLCSTFESGVKGLGGSFWKECLGALPPEGLATMAHALRLSLNDAADRRQYWRKIRQWWQWCSPVSANRRTEELSEELALLAVLSGEDFEVAVKMFGNSLVKLGSCYELCRRLLDAGCCRDYPREAVDLLWRTVGDRTWDTRQALRPCLDAVKEAAPEVTKDWRFQDLERLCPEREEWRTSGGSGRR
ncbi:MAG: SIR2 family protein [Succinivibrio sp.]|nr:SIR2 family protein [Succinivibrio sp.]